MSGTGRAVALWPGMKTMLRRPVGLRYLCCAPWLQHPPVSGLNSLPGAGARADFPHPLPSTWQQAWSFRRESSAFRNGVFLCVTGLVLPISKLCLCSQSEVKCGRKVQHRDHALENFYHSKVYERITLAKCTTTVV